tara:strand:- start:899 stop:1222 length:324 start_codon:yes stop_codon:yes gene_type:complete
MATNDELFTLEEISIKLRVHINTVRNLIRKQELPALKFGNSWRVRGSALKSYLRKNTSSALAKWAEADRCAPSRSERVLISNTMSTPDDVVYPVNTPRYLEEDLFDE